MCFIMCIGIVAVAQAQEGKIERFDDWGVMCRDLPNNPPCEMIQTLSDKESGTPLLRISLADSGSKEQDLIAMQIVTRPGVFVATGVLIQIDGENKTPEGLKFTRCSSGGCFIDGLVKSKDIAPFKKGKNGIFAVNDSTRKPRSYPISLEGFQAAYAEMQNRNESWFNEAKKASSQKK